MTQKIVPKSMKMYWFYWPIIAFLLGSFLIITVYARKYMKSVADFLTANRMAGRYMLTVSSGFGGPISIM